MLYLAIDQHKDQLTINLRNEHGDVIQKEQVSTKHNDINEFFDKLVKKARQHRGFMAILEVCGFNDWLIEKLKKYNCNEIVLIQPDHSSNKKTDQRDANALGELLWNNRKRLQGGKRPNGIRRIIPADPKDAKVRQLANFRLYLVSQRTRAINKIKGIINKHNMAQDAPTKDCKTKKFRQWIQAVSLPVIDSIEVNMNLEAWKLYDRQILEIEGELVKLAESNPAKVFKLKSIPGISVMGAIMLLSRIGDITRFLTPGSLANYFGLTPGCHNTAGKQRLGGVTKAGSPIARQVLNFAVIHVLRKDPQMKAWHKKIKARKGAKTARVAVMRKLATIIWHMLRWDKPYQFRYEEVKPITKKKKKTVSVPTGRRFSGHGNDNHHGVNKSVTPLKNKGKPQVKSKA
ncbi:MAG: IS110 family transposase [Culicoidibacterales bacterium]